MGHIPDDENNEEFMNASAEEWSKPSETPSEPEAEIEPTDRWGSPISNNQVSDDPQRWGSETGDPSRPAYNTQPKKSGTKWWIILIVLAALLCLCACVVLIGLPLLGIEWFQGF